jgi:hypothetical protein
MQSTVSPGVLSVSPSSLAAAATDVPDPRQAASVISSLPAILALVVGPLPARA